MVNKYPRATKTAVTASAIAALAAFAATEEGTRYIPYFDPPGILTVCQGHTGPEIIKNKKYTNDECAKFLAEDAKEALEIVASCVPYELPPSVFIAFSDAVFNLGPKIACDPKQSHAAKYLQAGEFKLACAELPKWDKARVAGVLVPLPGLTKRRNREYKFCITDLV